MLLPGVLGKTTSRGTLLCHPLCRRISLLLKPYVSGGSFPQEEGNKPLLPLHNPALLAKDPCMRFTSFTAFKVFLSTSPGGVLASSSMRKFQICINQEITCLILVASTMFSFGFLGDLVEECGNFLPALVLIIKGASHDHVCISTVGAEAEREEAESSGRRRVPDIVLSWILLCFPKGEVTLKHGSLALKTCRNLDPPSHH